MSTAAAKRSPMFWVPSLYLAQGLPFFAVNLIAQQMLISMEVPNALMTRCLGVLSIAWGIKWLWSPFLELAPSKKSIVVTFQLIGCGGLALVAFALHLPIFLVVCIAALGLVSLASATHDIASDGLYIASLDKKQQAAYAGWQGAFFNVARYISAGGLMVLADAMEKSQGVVSAWSTIFAVLSGAMLVIGLYNAWALPGTRNVVSSDKSTADVGRTLWHVIQEFLRKPGVWLAIAFIILFRASEGQVQTIGPIFLRAARDVGGLGLSTGEVGWAYGTAGTIAFIAGSIVGGYFAAWLGLKRAMVWLILAMNLPSVAFVFLSTAMPTHFAVIAAALSLEMFGYGFGFVGVILYLMQVVSVGRYQTAHYAIGSGVMGLGMSLFRTISGDIQVALGYQNFFLWGLACAVPVLILARFVPLESKPVEPAAPAQVAEA
ncbi:MULTISPECIES: MFS transporter [unclassified Rhizobacter]|uniref:MFS transporter n=1 Tax=unclassified Rhizobacter TaxID=2640088 RepID=UPI0006FBE190|nr:MULTISPECIES: MFS transporter [unclassified Rhizobacter]KQU77152.1 MFS transporter [Rhizobacter sp. Root29]KQW12774.1 MFS transporter [Rhizobacter sp. Root1238]KRB22362.1 MFS transporter [Rhizobacter sp. Root16D2]